MKFESSKLEEAYEICREVLKTTDSPSLQTKMMEIMLLMEEIDKEFMGVQYEKTN